jgi:hypothetical protein
MDRAFRVHRSLSALQMSQIAFVTLRPVIRSTIRPVGYAAQLQYFKVAININQSIDYTVWFIAG